MMGDPETSKAWERVTGMVQRHLGRGPYRLNPDEVTVRHVLEGLTRNLVNHGRWYCPCREVTGRPEQDRVNICPCPQRHADIARTGACECGLFASEEYAAASPLGSDSPDKEET